MNFKKHQTAQKLRGGYYTPPDLADFLVRWVKEIKPKDILEPACGDGVFFAALGRMSGFKNANVLGFELDTDEAAKARRVLSSGTVRAKDFLSWALPHLRPDGARFDAVLGNPPFVRYQYLPPDFQTCSEQIFARLGCHFTKHTNAWVPFVLASLAMLRPGGRLAMVVPAELIHVTHAQSLRAYLGAECSRLVIIDPEELWFDGTLQGAVLLMAEKKKGPAESAQGVGIHPVRGREFLKKAPGDVFKLPVPINGKTVAGKWTRALLDVSTRRLIDELEEREDISVFEDVATVDVGIVTGANKFFLVDDETVDRFALSRWAHPMFGRSEHCPGIIYDARQHEANAGAGYPTNFLLFDEKAGCDPRVQAYIKTGEAQKLHTRYKCRIRAPWYRVPSVYSTQIGMLKRSHHVPRLILNKASAYTTDTAYRIRSKQEAEQLVASFINPLTALSAELEGRHYGGGVLELVPSEIEKLLIPVPKKRFDVSKVDEAVRNQPAEEVLEIHGGAVLESLGFPRGRIEELLLAWKKLRNRRQRISADELYSTSVITSGN